MPRVPLFLLLTAIGIGLLFCIIPTGEPVEQLENPEKKEAASENCELKLSAPDDLTKSLITCIQTPRSGSDKTDNQLVTKLVQSTIAEDFLATKILGENRSAVDLPSLVAFQDALSAVVARLIIKNFSEINLQKTSPFEVKFATDASKVNVTFSIKPENPSGYLTEVSIKLTKRTGSDDWKIYDVVFTNIGFVMNFRAEFTKLVKKHGLDYAIKKVVARNEAVARKS